MQPVIGRPMWGCQPSVAALNSVLFVSALSLSSGQSLCRSRLIYADVARVGTIASYHLKKRPVAVKGCRNISKKDMKLNNALPDIKVDPETYRVGRSSSRTIVSLAEACDDRSKRMECFAQSDQRRNFPFLRITCCSSLPFVSLIFVGSFCGGSSTFRGVLR